ARADCDRRIRRRETARKVGDPPLTLQASQDRDEGILERWRPRAQTQEGKAHGGQGITYGVLARRWVLHHHIEAVAEALRLDDLGPGGQRRRSAAEVSRAHFQTR